jgi:subtilisin family serine protease
MRVDRIADMTERALVVNTLIFIAMTCGCRSTAMHEGVVPDDPYFEYQVSFENKGGRFFMDRLSYKPSPINLDLHEDIKLNITRAWAITTGSKEIIVALIDDGFFYHHEDIIDNIWANRGETGPDERGYPKESNGIDDDGNGYVDDVIGWDFAFEDPDPDPYIYHAKNMNKISPNWHSISAMGIIGARGNNGRGIAGINWEVSMMLLKCGAQGDTDRFRIERVAKSIRYAVDNGARVINWSGFVTEKDPEELLPLQEALDYAESKDVLLVSAAGNSNVDLDKKENFVFPECARNENLITVAEIDFDGCLYKEPEGTMFIGGSNFGVENVDIAAIGQNYTTDLEHNRSVYTIGAGTSDAAPVVAGVAALILSARPDLGGLDVKKIIMESARKLPALMGKIRSGGFVDAYAAVNMALRK